MSDDYTPESLTPAPTRAPAPEPELVEQHYLDPDTGERRATIVRILRRGKRPQRA